MLAASSAAANLPRADLSPSFQRTTPSSADPIGCPVTSSRFQTCPPGSVRRPPSANSNHRRAPRPPCPFRSVSASGSEHSFVTSTALSRPGANVFASPASTGPRRSSHREPSAWSSRSSRSSSCGTIHRGSMFQESVQTHPVPHAQTSHVPQAQCVGSVSRSDRAAKQIEDEQDHPAPHAPFGSQHMTPMAPLSAHPTDDPAAAAIPPSTSAAPPHSSHPLDQEVSAPSRLADPLATQLRSHSISDDAKNGTGAGAPKDAMNGYSHGATPTDASSSSHSSCQLTAMPYLPPRRAQARGADAATATVTTPALKPSPPSTDATPSANPAAPSSVAAAVDVPPAQDYSQLPPDLDATRLPGHVAIILDGNSRWAKRRGMPKEFGHEAGVKALREAVKRCGEWGIKALTVFAFSTENWGRPKAEVDFLMTLLGRMMDEEIDELHRQGVAVRVIGDSSRLSTQLRKKVTAARNRTHANTRLRLSIAVSYSGRMDIVTACQAIAQRVADGKLLPSQVSEAIVEEELGTGWLGPGLSSPDLLIRTSGEQRLSNFLLWQSAYTELYFCDTLWPDFGGAELHAAVREFQRRDRRFGTRKEGR